MSTDDVARAGVVILSDLRLFSESVLFFENHIEPRICSEIESLITTWAKSSGWISWDSSVEDGLWLAPPDWRLGEEETYLAGFGFGPRSEEDVVSYSVTNIFREGNTDWGFWFEVEHKHFGGKKAWNLFAKTLNKEIDELQKIGWCYMGSGSFFLLAPLSAKSLPSAWENEDWEESLLPLKLTMDALFSARTIFDGIIAKAPRSDGQQ